MRANRQSATDSVGDGPATRAAKLFVDRAVIIIIVSWTVLFTALYVALATEAVLLALSVGAGAAVLVATTLFAAKRLSGLGLYLVTVITCGTLLIATAMTDTADTPYFAFIGWASVIGVVAGLALPRPKWQVVLAASAGSLLLIVATLEVLTGEFGLRYVVSAPLAALAYGMMSGRTLDVVLDVGNRDDIAAQSARESAVAAQAAQALADESFRLSRMLHDGVVNTLGALRWSALVDAQRLRAMCARDLVKLRRLASELDAPQRQLHDVQALADELGATAELHQIAMSVDLQCQGVRLPEDAFGAIQAALEEAVLNIRKHSDSRSASLVAQFGRGVLQLRFEDYGTGIASESQVSSSGGIAQSIHARCARAGVVVEVGRSITGGVRYDFSITVPSTSEVDDEASESSPVAGAGSALQSALVVVAVSTAFWLLTRLALDVPFDWYMAPWWWWSTITATVIGVVALVALGARRHGVLESWRAVVAVTAVLFVSAVPAPSVASCVTPGFGVWQSFAAFIIATCVVWLTRGYLWTLAACGALVAGWSVSLMTAHLLYGCSLELAAFLILDPLALGGLWLLRNYLERLGSQAQEMIETDLRNRQLEVEATNRNAVRQRVAAITAEAGLPLLSGIAEGALDPSSSTVRNEARQVEAFLRCCSQLDAGHGPLAGVLLETCRLAFRRRVQVSLLFAEFESPSPSAISELRRFLYRIACTSRPASQLDISVLGTDGAVTLTLQAGIEAGRSAATISDRTLQFVESTDGDTSCFHISWALSS